MRSREERARAKARKASATSACNRRSKKRKGRYTKERTASRQPCRQKPISIVASEFRSARSGNCAERLRRPAENKVPCRPCEFDPARYARRPTAQIQTTLAIRII